MLTLPASVRVFLAGGVGALTLDPQDGQGLRPLRRRPPAGRDREVSRKYTVVRTYIRCREIVRDVVMCTGCGRTTTAAMPPMPCQRSLFTFEFLAWLVVQRFVLLVPFDRIRRLLVSQRIDLPMSTPGVADRPRGDAARSDRRRALEAAEGRARDPDRRPRSTPPERRLDLG
ncbi:hypothetical protein [Methyloglobulus sp.]|uniref:hypothetical protein n=1 Tax=Methyloglobulus sp. TaxID=2518622 RepID=UPI0032B83673